MSTILSHANVRRPPTVTTTNPGSGVAAAACESVQRCGSHPPSVTATRPGSGVAAAACELVCESAAITRRQSPRRGRFARLGPSHHPRRRADLVTLDPVPRRLRPKRACPGKWCAAYSVSCGIMSGSSDAAQGTEKSSRAALNEASVSLSASRNRKAIHGAADEKAECPSSAGWSMGCTV
ncbi:hypothetical protein RJ55_02871 [Drechmeria coniospora]|nr:hypothetical protein RJ55_02871 [Drechmeria coniospora]